MKRSPTQRKAMQHNSLIGLAVCIQKNAMTVTDSATTTDEAYHIATGIYNDAKKLEQALRAGRKS